jgi:hypothetical protein
MSAYTREPNKATKRRIKQLIAEAALAGQELIEYRIDADDGRSNWTVTVEHNDERPRVD